jgi:membrane protease subunit (stomatin/prohibitin family)
MPLLRTVGRTAVIAGTASAVGGRVQHKQQGKWAEQEQQQAAQQQAAPPAAAEPEGDPMERLAKLGELHSSGVLTDEEFAVAKAKILNA